MCVCKYALYNIEVLKITWTTVSDFQFKRESKHVKCSRLEGIKVYIAA